ncbi:hypothetical protein COLO4_08904 [Corchorus olitorius]|uniref:Uncharacterized protein n=1 Tax=Corchorus olitorius TaxID=93759 RepID=A0A1R3KE29_9ROSI|nr:hypothetical protein COLO4_08904 [Corchorus olitorius]
MVTEKRKSDKPESSKKMKDKWHHLRYESLTDFKLLGTKVLDWDSLMKNPKYVPVYNMLEKVGWIGLTKFSNEKPSLTAVKKFYSGIVTKGNLYHGDKVWNREDMFAFFCGKEVVVTTSMLDSQITQALESLTNAITVINTNMNQMRKSNLKYQQSTQKILGHIADKILGESLENEVPLEESEEVPQEEEHLPKETENVVEQEKDKEDREEKKYEYDNVNVNDGEENEEEQEQKEGLEDDAGEELNLEGEDGNDLKQDEEMAEVSEKDDIESSEKAPSAAVSETNVSEASSETNSERDDSTLATTEERVLKPKKKVTKKATTATDKTQAHATESDVVSEATKLPSVVPSKRPRTKHPTVDAFETIPAAASKPAKAAGTRQSKWIKKA